MMLEPEDRRSSEERASNGGAWSARHGLGEKDNPYRDQQLAELWSLAFLDAHEGSVNRDK